MKPGKAGRSKKTGGIADKTVAAEPIAAWRQATQAAGKSVAGNDCSRPIAIVGLRREGWEGG